MVPPVRADAVPRLRLSALREAAQRSRVVLVSAPAGYGKSTLVAQWSALDPRPGGWVQLARGDNDPVVLLARIVAALERTGPLRGDLLEALSRRTPRIVEAALPLLAADLSERDPFLLVLDDVDLITSRRSRSILAFLAEQVPAGSQLVLITRGDPGMRRGRLRAGGDLTEIGTQLLALDSEETRAVAALGGLDLSEKEAEALRERTEGWAAGVALAALSSRDRDNGGASVAALAGTQPQIADYLLDEVLGRQPEDLRTFLLATSILRRMTPALCNAVLATEDAADSLETLARSNAFVVPLDDRGEWYRYHHLFRDLLRNELERRHPELRPVYLKRAADWSEEHGGPEEAFTYAHESSDLDQAGRVALKHWDELTGSGRIETLRLWLKRCTDTELESDAQLAIAAAWAAALLGDPVKARRFIAAAERKPLDVPSADGASSLRSALAIVRCTVAPDGIHGMLRDAEYVYGAEKHASRWLLSACRALGTANVLLGRPQEALNAFAEALTLCGDRPELAHIRLYCLSYMAFAATEIGERRDAQRFAFEALLLVDEARLDEIAQSAIAHAAGAQAHQQRGDQAEAARQLEHVRRLRPLLHGVTWLDADLALRCGEISLSLGDLAGALGFKLAANDALRAYPDAGTIPARLDGLRERIRRGKDYELTPAELRLISFLPTHLSLQEIADRLYVSRPTVKTQVASIYDKLGVKTRSEAVEIIDQYHLGATDGRPSSSDPTTD